MKVHKRKFSNFLLQPLLQIRLGFYSILISLLFSGTIAAIVYTNFFRFYDLVLELTDLRDDIEGILKNYVQGMATWILLAMLVYVLLTVAVSIFFTHRLVGPTYAFRRHIREIIRGNYSSRVVLRRDDAFQEVAEELNQLAIHLDNLRRR